MSSRFITQTIAASEVRLSTGCRHVRVTVAVARALHQRAVFALKPGEASALTMPAQPAKRAVERAGPIRDGAVFARKVALADALAIDALAIVRARACVGALPNGTITRGPTRVARADTRIMAQTISGAHVRAAADGAVL